MRIHIILVFIFLSVQLSGQQRPDFFPEQLQEIEKPLCCQPGLQNKTKTRLAELSYNIIGRGKFEGENNTMLSEPFTDITSRRELFLKLKTPMIHKPGIKVLAGFAYKIEQYKIKSVGQEFSETFQYLNDLDLRTVSFDLQVIKSINEQSYFIGSVNQGFNGDLNGLFDLKRKYSVFQAVGLYGYKFSDQREAGIGMVYSQDFSDTNWLPILIYNHNFAPKWGIEAALPLSIYLKSFRDEKTIVSIGAEYMGSIFNITHADQNFAFDHAAIAGTILIEKQIAPWFWFYSKIGFQTNFSSTFAPLNATTIPFEVDQTDTPFFKLSLFMSPPDSFFK